MSGARIRGGLGLTAGWNDGDAYGPAGNADLYLLDAVVQLSVLSRTTSAAPGSPADGDRYIVAASGSGAWLAQDGKVAVWDDDRGWTFYAPKNGWLAWVVDESLAYVFNGAAWVALTVPDDHKSIASATDTTPAPLQSKILAGPGITITRNNPGANETLTISAPSIVGADAGDWVAIKNNSRMILKRSANGIELMSVDVGEYSQSGNLHHYVMSHPSGGVVLFWQSTNAYAQWFDSSGTARWGGGTAIVVGTGHQSTPTRCAAVAFVTDGWIMFWDDYDDNSHPKLKAMKVALDGSLAWAAPVVVCSPAGGSPGKHYALACCPDNSPGTGGAYVFWGDNGVRGGDAVGWTKLYGQRLNPAGVPQWATDGIQFAFTGGLAYQPQRAMLIGTGTVMLIYHESVNNTLSVKRIGSGGSVAWSAAAGFGGDATVDATGNTLFAPAGNTAGANGFVDKLGSAAGSVIWGPTDLGQSGATAVSYQAPGLQCSLADGSDGSWITLLASNVLYYGRVNSSGTLTTTLTAIESGLAGSAHYRAMSLDANGDLHVVYVSGSSYKMVIISKNTGLAVSGPYVLTPTTSTDTPVSLVAGKRFL